LADDTDLSEPSNSSPEHAADNLPFLAINAAPSAHINSPSGHSTNALLVDTNTANCDNAPTTNNNNNASHKPPFPPNVKAVKVEDELLLVHEYL
jgi:hypothetical protein